MQTFRSIKYIGFFGLRYGLERGLIRNPNIRLEKLYYRQPMYYMRSFYLWFCVINVSFLHISSTSSKLLAFLYVNLFYGSLIVWHITWETCIRKITSTELKSKYGFLRNLDGSEINCFLGNKMCIFIETNLCKKSAILFKIRCFTKEI